jgi:hypothetical protein
LLDHEPCGGLRSSLELVIGSIGFWRNPIDSLSYLCCFEFYFMFKFM